MRRGFGRDKGKRRGANFELKPEEKSRDEVEVRSEEAKEKPEKKQKESKGKPEKKHPIVDAIKIWIEIGLGVIKVVDNAVELKRKIFPSKGKDVSSGESS